jgi:hypothetical protein
MLDGIQSEEKPRLDLSRTGESPCPESSLPSQI